MDGSRNLGYRKKIRVENVYRFPSTTEHHDPFPTSSNATMSGSEISNTARFSSNVFNCKNNGTTISRNLAFGNEDGSGERQMIQQSQHNYSWGPRFPRPLDELGSRQSETSDRPTSPMAIDDKFPLDKPSTQYNHFEKSATPYSMGPDSRFTLFQNIHGKPFQSSTSQPHQFLQASHSSIPNAIQILQNTKLDTEVEDYVYDIYFSHQLPGTSSSNIFFPQPSQANGRGLIGSF